MQSSEFSVVVEAQGSELKPAVPSGWIESYSFVGALRVRCVRPADHDSAIDTAIVTMHDIGLNAGSCFQGFFDYCLGASACKELFSAMHIHLDVRGCEDGADTTQASIIFETLTESVEHVVKTFPVKNIIGFGVGLGASVLLDFAKKEPRNVHGLVLVSPLVFGPSFIERASSFVSTGVMSGVGLGRRLKDGMLSRWFSQDTIDHNVELVRRFDDAMDRMNASNMAKYCYAEASRPDLSQDLSNLRARVLLISGKDSPLRWHSSDSFSLFDPEKVSWIDVEEAGSMVVEERPDEVARALSLFLQGCCL